MGGTEGDMAEIGSLIHEKYRIIKKIGQGGMSKVYLAKNSEDHSLWAIKEVERVANDKNSQVVVQSLLTEAKLIKKLEHPALPKIDDVIEEGNTIYLIMEYIDGRPLDTVLEQQGAQKQEDVVRWALQLCGVLNYLHSQTPPIIYRDMKPSNIMLMADGNIKLIDFGIAREYKEENVADTVNLGTKGYAAPEQFGGNGQTDARTDIYCLGVTLYHLITGKNPSEPPYEMYPIRYWNEELSAGLEQIIKTATQSNPKDRYQCCADMMYAIKHYKEVDETDDRKKKGKVKCAIGLYLSCIILSSTTIVLFSKKSDIALYTGVAAVCLFLISVFYSIKSAMPRLLYQLYFSKHKKKKQSKPSLVTGQMGNDATTLLDMEEVEETGGTEVLQQTEEYATSLLYTEEEDVKQQDNSTTVLSENSTNESEAGETTILDLSVEQPVKPKEKKAAVKKITEDFEIIETITLIHTKERIA